MGGSAAGVNAMFGALEEIFNPAAARARKELQEQHERVVRIPSPGDKILAEGKVVIPRTSKAQPSSAKSPETHAPEQQPPDEQPPDEQPPDEQPPKERVIHLETD
jgi:hypothetical protein